MARIITQIIIGLMLIFGAVTLVSGGLLHLRARTPGPRPLMYLFLGALAGLLGVACFLLALGWLGD